MKTITAKDLRDNLDEITKRVRRGESIRVTYRSKPAFTLQPDNPKGQGTEPGSPAAMREFIQMTREANKRPRASSLDTDKSIKELYDESLGSDPKYSGSYE